MRVFYTYKLENILEKIELTDWRHKLSEPLTYEHQNLSDNWKSCALGERIRKEGSDLSKVKDLTPDSLEGSCIYVDYIFLYRS